ncbi:MAG TPA: dipeptide epimerase [Bacteroidetes bacterium]|nr:dipeptide epimerase [Bacteroidota bacterium]
MKLSSRIYDLELKHTFGISRGSHDIQRTLIVRLEQDGKVGYGEAVEDPYYGFTVEGMQQKLEELRPLIEEYYLEDPENFWDELHKYLHDNRFLHCAIDIAANDLYGKIKGKPLYEIWGQKTDNIPMTNYTIGLDSLEVMKEKLLEFPWPLYKIKLGTKNDVEIIKELRKLTDATFRVDANTAWGVEETIENSKALKDLGVEFIEQPMAHDNWVEMEEVYKGSVLPLMADESCRTEEDVPKCVNRFTGINVKLVKAGGLTPARRMLIEGRSLGLKTMVGCMTESSVGIAAVGQLLPYLDYVDMDGALLLKNDIGYAHDIDNGVITLSERPGTGVVLNEPF